MLTECRATYAVLLVHAFLCQRRLICLLLHGFLQWGGRLNAHVAGLALISSVVVLSRWGKCVFWGEVIEKVVSPLKPTNLPVFLTRQEKLACEGVVNLASNRGVRRVGASPGIPQGCGHVTHEFALEGCNGGPVAHS